MAEPCTNSLYTTGKGTSSSQKQLTLVCTAASGFHSGTLWIFWGQGPGLLRNTCETLRNLRALLLLSHQARGLREPQQFPRSIISCPLT